MKRGRNSTETDHASSSKKIRSCGQNSKDDLKKYICELIKEQTVKFQDQNVKIMEAMAEQHILIKTLVREDLINGQLTASFPLNSESDLDAFNKQIDGTNKSVYVKAMKNIIRNNLSKNLPAIITEECLYEYNVDGSHGKKGLKNLTNLYDVIRNIVALMPGVENVEGHIRKAVHLIKKRHLKKLLKEKKTKETEQHTVPEKRNSKDTENEGHNSPNKTNDVDSDDDDDLSIEENDENED